MKKIIFSTVLALIFSLNTFAQSLGGLVNIGDMTNGVCLALSDPTPNSGKEIILGSCDNSLYKNWKLSDVGKGSYTITNEKSGLCLGVSEPLKSQVSRIVQSKNSGQSDVQWQFIETKDGSYKIQNLKSGLCLTVITPLSKLEPNYRIGLCPDDEKKYPIKWAVKPTFKIPVVKKGLSFNADGSVYMDGVFVRTIANFNNPNYTVFFISRHAERGVDAGDNTLLSDIGTARAQRLATILKFVPIIKVGSTNTVRTIATGKPTADSKNLPVTIYGAFGYFAECMANNGPNSKHLVISHAGTVTTILQHLTGQTVTYNEGGFDNLFVVVVQSVGAGTVYHFKY